MSEESNCPLCGNPLHGETWQDYDDYGDEMAPAHTKCFDRLRVWDSRLNLPANAPETEKPPSDTEKRHHGHPAHEFDRFTQSFNVADMVCGEIPQPGRFSRMKHPRR